MNILFKSVLLCGIILGFCQKGFANQKNDKDPLNIFQKAMLDSGLYVQKGAYIYPAPFQRPKEEQGWKVHIGATPEEAKRILESLLPLTVDSGYPFKICACVETLGRMNQSEYKGRFITLYQSQEKTDLPLFQDVILKCDNALLSLNLQHPICNDYEEKLGTSGAMSCRYGSFVNHYLLAETAEEGFNVVEYIPDTRFSPDHSFRNKYELP